MRTSQPQDKIHGAGKPLIVVQAGVAGIAMVGTETAGVLPDTDGDCPRASGPRTNCRI